MKQVINIILGIALFVLVVAAVAAIGEFAIGKQEKDESIQGQVEVEEYRVSFKIPGRIKNILVREGDHVRAGDRLAVLDAPDIEAKHDQATSVVDAATAMSDMANNGAREEQIRGARELWEQAKAAKEIMEKSYERVNRLYEGGVMTAQKRDETLAQYKAATAQCEAAKSQYDMAVKGAREEEKRAAAAKRSQAQGVVKEVNSYINETVQRAEFDGEVAAIYPKVGELVGSGSPVMTIAMMDDAWGTFNIREDKLKGIKIGSVITAFCPAFDKDIKLKVFAMKDQGTYATWKATKEKGQYDIKTFEVKARPVNAEEGLRPGMSLILNK
ncbi:MAG: HlyD family efflux transporter periplasmic adaptor subunit [Bacteroidaceae bacterium]|nr:HlyD family efflux transporter periplasmic adaptor subunit [Bacteroidaceae bacterium]